MDASKLLGLQGGDIASDTTVNGNFSCAQASGDVIITAIVQPDMSPTNGRNGDTILDGGFIYGAITSITFVGKLVLFKNHLSR